jgi:hypothetical protein
MISTIFYPGAYETESNLIFVTSDQVLLYLNSDIMRKHSKQAFEGLIRNADVSAKGERTIRIPELSDVLEVVGLFLYGRAFDAQIPPLRTLINALHAMSRYDIDPHPYLVPGNPCYDNLLSYSPRFPLEVYTLAAQLDAEPLAIATSTYLLSMSMSTITDEMALQIGARYLKRLMDLHHTRSKLLVDALFEPPRPHAPTRECNFSDQKKLREAWSLTAGHIAWKCKPGEEIRPMDSVDLLTFSLKDMSVNEIRVPFSPGNETWKDFPSCTLCKAGLEKRLSEIIYRWITSKVNE